ERAQVAPFGNFRTRGNPAGARPFEFEARSHFAGNEAQLSAVLTRQAARVSEANPCATAARAHRLGEQRRASLFRNARAFVTDGKRDALVVTGHRHLDVPTRW